MPFLKHLVEPQLKQHLAKLQAELPPPAPAATGAAAPAAPRPVAFLPAATGAVSEKGARAAIDKQRGVQRATDEGKTRISEALQRVLGVDRTHDIGPGGQNPIARRNRIDALANKQEWTPEDLRTMSKRDLQVARGAREMLRDSVPPEGTMFIPGDYAIATDPFTGDRSVEMFTPELPAGQDVGGLRGLLMNDMRFQGAQRPGDAIRAAGYERPLPLQDALRGMSPGEAVGFLANQMRLDALEKQTGFRPTSI